MVEMQVIKEIPEIPVLTDLREVVVVVEMVVEEETLVFRAVDQDLQVEEEIQEEQRVQGNLEVVVDPVKVEEMVVLVVLVLLFQLQEELPDMGEEEAVVVLALEETPEILAD